MSQFLSPNKKFLKMRFALHAEFTLNLSHVKNAAKIGFHLKSHATIHNILQVTEMLVETQKI